MPERTSRRVSLTEAGSVLPAEGRAILGAVAAAERRAQRAAMNRPALVLATKAGAAGGLLAKLLDAYAAEPDAVAVDLLLCESQPHQPLHDGRADVALPHQPFDPTAGLDTEGPTTGGTGRRPAHLASARLPSPRPGGGGHFAAEPPAGPAPAAPIPKVPARKCTTRRNSSS